MKKLTSIVLCVFLCISFASCSNKTSKEKTSKNFTYWCSFPSYAEGEIENLGEMLMYKEMEKITGVHIEFQHPPSGADNEQFNLLMAGGINKLPDMIEFGWGGYPGGPDVAIKDGIILDLSDLIDKHAPNLKKVLKNNEQYTKPITTDSGKIYGFPVLNVGKYRTFGGLIIRQDWLDDLGLKMPETIDEWEVTLRAFKEQKGATAPLTLTSSQLTGDNAYHFSGAFDVNNSSYIDNGTFKYPPLEDGYKNYLELMNKWYNEGLLDVEFDTNSNSVIDAKMTSGQSGATYGYIGSTMGKYMNKMKSVDTAYSIAGAPFPVLNRGDIVRFAECQSEAATMVVAITANCKDPVGAVKWLDFLYSKEGEILKNFGVEGITYEVINGKHVYTDLILDNPDGLSISEAMAMNFRASAPAPGFNQNEEYLNQYYQLDEQKEALELWSTYTPAASQTIVPPIMHTKEESEELKRITTEMNSYVDEMIVKFIKGEESLDNYDSFKETLIEMGVLRYIEIKQAAYDRYCKR